MEEWCQNGCNQLTVHARVCYSTIIIPRTGGGAAVPPVGTWFGTLHIKVWDLNYPAASTLILETDGVYLVVPYYLKTPFLFIYQYFTIYKRSFPKCYSSCWKILVTFLLSCPKKYRTLIICSSKYFTNVSFSLIVPLIIISFEVLQQQTFVKPLKSIALAGGGENYY